MLTMKNLSQSLLLAFLVLIVPAAARAQLVSAGGGHTLGAAPDGTAWAWGRNIYGQLGDGTSTNRTVPTQVSGLTHVVAVAAGNMHSLALKSDGSVWAWGDNGWGQLGDSTWTNRNSPVYVQVLTNVTKIAAGWNHSLAIKSDGTVWAWGQNTYGQLGTGSTTAVNVPTQVSTLSSVTAIAGGGTFSLAVKSDGTVWSWGRNANGQLGNGTTTASLSPIQTTGVTNATGVAAGDCHALALISGGTVQAWGCNNYGQIGDNSYNQRTSPVTLTALSGVSSVSAGVYYSFAVKTDGTLRAWGDNSAAQLGDGTWTTRIAPVSISGVSSLSHAAGGSAHSVAVSSTGIVYVWGSNNYGQVGDGTTTARSTPVAISDAGFAWKVAVPTFSVATGTYSQPQSVSITSATAGAVIRYSTDGTDPTEAYPSVTGTISVDGTTTLKARAWYSTWAPSSVSSVALTFVVSNPTLSPAGGTYSAAQTVTMTTSSTGAVIRYTTDGSTPTEFSPQYSAPLSIGAPMTLKAKAFKYGWTASAMTSGAYSFTNYVPPPAVPSPGAGTYAAAPVIVTLGPIEPDMVVFYSLDGTEPNIGYGDPLVIERTTLIRTKTRKWQPNGTYAYSPPTGFLLVLQVAQPAVSLTPGQHAPGTVSQISSTTPGAVIRYRLDGQTPTDTDPQVPLDGRLVVGNFTLKVRGFYQFMDPSDVATATYTVSSTYNSGVIAGGGRHSVALTPDGTLWSWGYNGSRQLGFGERWNKDPFYGTVSGELVVPQVNTPQAEAITGVRAVSTGGNDFTIALRHDGTVLSWGSDYYGELGRNGCDTDYISPSTYCVRPGQLTLTGIVAIAAGGAHAITVKADGSVWAWGRNDHGQVGDGTMTSRSLPVQVTGLTNVVAVAAGHDHSLALRSDGTVWAWGQTAVGDGAGGDRLAPVQVVGLTGTTSLSAGYGHSTALDASGNLRTWGNNTNGQLGDGTTMYRDAPVQVLSNVLQAAAGAEHVIAVKLNGSVWAWGRNSDGQLGDGTTTGRLVPTLVSTVTEVRGVAAGTHHSFAIVRDGSALAWGDSLHGQIGDGTVVDKVNPVAIFPVDTFGPGECVASVTVSAETTEVGLLRVTTPDWCNWTVDPEEADAWLTLDTTSGTGAATLGFVIDRSVMPAPQTASVANSVSPSFFKVPFVGCVLFPIPFIDSPPGIPTQWCFTPAPPGGQGQGADAVLARSSGTVLRGQQASFTLLGAPNAQVLGWTFVGTDVGTITRTQTVSSSGWSGPMVSSGTVTVRYRLPGQSETTRSAAVVVTPRDFMTPTAPADQVANGAPRGTCTFTRQDGTIDEDALTLPVPVPEVIRNGDLGRNCLEPLGGIVSNVVPENGPNSNVKWVERFATNDAPRWRYRWVINPDLDDVTCAFYQQQTGTFHELNNPSGWISGINLRANVIRHESDALVQSHYAQFRAANIASNPGGKVEGLLGLPTTTLGTFAAGVNNVWQDTITAVQLATKTEPFGGNYDAAGNFQGYTKSTGYGPGCHP